MRNSAFRSSVYRNSVEIQRISRRLQGMSVKLRGTSCKMKELPEFLSPLIGVDHNWLPSESTKANRMREPRPTSKTQCPRHHRHESHDPPEPAQTYPTNCTHVKLSCCRCGCFTMKRTENLLGREPTGRFLMGEPFKLKLSEIVGVQHEFIRNCWGPI